jgi:putative PIN family toxin of toxin-antitoxin system
VRIVLDTNVLVSGLLVPGGTTGRIVAAWRGGRFDLLVCVPQLGEIARVLAYPRIRRVLHWDDARIESFIRQLYVRAETVDVARLPADVPRDAADAPILAALLNGRGDLLVTGDGHLLDLRDAYPIETPTEFVRRL